VRLIEWSRHTLPAERVAIQTVTCRLPYHGSSDSSLLLFAGLLRLDPLQLEQRTLDLGLLLLNCVQPVLHFLFSFL
jgi:hypothetical protein